MILRPALLVSPLLLGPLLLAAGGAPLSAQVVEIRELHPLGGPGVSVDIEVVEHSVRVEVWDRGEVEVTGAYDSGIEILNVEAEPRAVYVEIDRNEIRRLGGGPLTVRVPSGVDLTVESVSGAIEVSGSFGPVRLESVGGSVTFQGSASSLDMASVSADVFLSGAAEQASAETVGGTVLAEGDLPLLRARSYSGEITVRLDLPVRELNLESVSGSVVYQGPLAMRGEIDVQTYSGRIELVLDESTAARFDLESFAGPIDADFPGVTEEMRTAARSTPGASLSFRTGSARGTIEVSSLSGNIVLRTP